MQVPYTHPADAVSPTFVDGQLVWPSQTVMREADEIEPAPAAAPTEPEPVDLVALRAQAVDAIKPQLAALSDADLAALAAAEEKDAKPRKTLLDEIAAVQLARETQG